ncbi:hypothetical protein B0J17DRAFT_708159 [Rhizoctonia solani]|nr:hypothetical protein B0J17DRAFT_708159 [Rhizoctonia solani]
MKISKEIYQTLGIAGKEANGAYSIQVDLKDKTTKLYCRAKDAVEGWDKTWEVWTTGDTDLSDNPMTKLPHTIKKFEPETVLLEDVLVPVGLPSDEDEDESWVELFEWVGMCTIGSNGSPRIASANQINPYISSYSAPEGSKTGSVLDSVGRGHCQIDLFGKLFKWQGKETKQGSSHSQSQPLTMCPRTRLGRDARHVQGYFAQGLGLWLKTYRRSAGKNEFVGFSHALTVIGRPDVQGADVRGRSVIVRSMSQPELLHVLLRSSVNNGHVSLRCAEKQRCGTEMVPTRAPLGACGARVLEVIAKKVAAGDA